MIASSVLLVYIIVITLFWSFSCSKDSLNHKPHSLSPSASWAQQHRTNCCNRFAPFGLYLHLCVWCKRRVRGRGSACLHCRVSLRVTGGDHTQPVCGPQCIPVEYLQQWRAAEAGGPQCTSFTPNYSLCWLRYHQTAGTSSQQSSIQLFFKATSHYLRQRRVH